MDRAGTAALAERQLACRVCTVGFAPESLEDAQLLLCSGCRDRAKAAARGGEQSVPRAFSAGELSLIRKLHGRMPAQQILDILNERLVADMRDDEPPYSLADLRGAVSTAASEPSGWASLRKRLAEARSTGVLDQVNEQLINDFAVVFSLSAKQVLQLKDVLLEGAR